MAAPKTRDRRNGTRPWRMAVVVVLGVLAALLALVLLRIGQWNGARPAASRPEAPPARSAAVETLHAWDAARARAWAAGDTRGLRGLYVPGSAAGDADVRLLRSYLARGFVVRRLRMQVLEVRVVQASADGLRLVVTDRLADAVAATGEQVVRLPGGAATTRTLVLRRRAGSWRMASVLSGPQ